MVLVERRSRLLGARVHGRYHRVGAGIDPQTSGYSCHIRHRWRLHGDRVRAAGDDAGFDTVFSWGGARRPRFHAVRYGSGRRCHQPLAAAPTIRGHRCLYDHRRPGRRGRSADRHGRGCIDWNLANALVGDGRLDPDPDGACRAESTPAAKGARGRGRGDIGGGEAQRRGVCHEARLAAARGSQNSAVLHHRCPR